MRTRDSRSAGTSPKSSAVGTSSAAVTASTVRFSVTGELAGTDSGRFATMASSESQASSTPSAAAGIARTTLSVSNCRIRRPRPAPSDARTASSDCRAAPLASSRPATLTTAMSRIRPTAPASTLTVVRYRDVDESSRDVTAARTSRTAGTLPSGIGPAVIRGDRRAPPAPPSHRVAGGRRWRPVPFRGARTPSAGSAEASRTASSR